MITVICLFFLKCNIYTFDKFNKWFRASTLSRSIFTYRRFIYRRGAESIYQVVLRDTHTVFDKKKTWPIELCLIREEPGRKTFLT